MPVSRLFALMFSFFLICCTGINLRIPMSPNTHPLPEYGKGTAILRGGLLYHKENSASHIRKYSPTAIGRACSHSFFYLIALGSSSIDAARLEGAVSKVTLVEQEVMAIGAGLYHRHCTIVIGE